MLPCRPDPGEAFFLYCPKTYTPCLLSSFNLPIEILPPDGPYHFYPLNPFFWPFSFLFFALFPSPGFTLFAAILPAAQPVRLTFSIYHSLCVLSMCLSSSHSLEGAQKTKNVLLGSFNRTAPCNRVCVATFFFFFFHPRCARLPI